MAGSRGQVGAREIGTGHVAVVHQRPQETEDHEEDQDAHADQGQPIRGELAERQPPPALHRTDLAALGGADQVERRECSDVLSHVVSWGSPGQASRMRGSATVSATSATRLPTTVRTAPISVYASSTL